MQLKISYLYAKTLEKISLYAKATRKEQVWEQPQYLKIHEKSNACHVLPVPYTRPFAQVPQTQECFAVAGSALASITPSGPLRKTMGVLQFKLLLYPCICHCVSDPRCWDLCKLWFLTQKP